LTYLVKVRKHEGQTPLGIPSYTENVFICLKYMERVCGLDSSGSVVGSSDSIYGDLVDVNEN
jgi:hypothetical protein